MSAGRSSSAEGEQEAETFLPEQREPMLRTKLFVPSTRAKHIVRPGLIERMNDILDKALILVSAPAGFGKTTLLAEWTSQASLPVAWLSLDAGDNDPNRFLRYVIAALEMAFAEQKPVTYLAAKDMLQSVQALPIQTILVALVNDLTDIPKPFCLVLDDYQFITSPAVNEALTFILEHLPPHAHLVIASRVDPSIPLHRLRAAQRLLEIRTDDLRFSRDDTHAFMNTVMGLRLSEEDISTLRDRTEGWIVGLQMAALSMQGLADHSAFVQALSGSQRYILEYLIEEVLARQPEDLQSFLLQTSILERLCAPLCNQVLGDREDSQTILEHLERYNIFLTPLDQVSYWYRYHHLFADLLRAQLQRSQPESLHTLHLRASQWYEEAGLPEEAIGHAFAAQEIERAAILVERNAIDIMSRGELSSLLGLFAALPEDLILRRPGLCLLQAWAFTFSGQLDKIEPQLQEVEKQILPDDTRREARGILGSIAIIRGLIADFRGDMASAIELAQRADEMLPKEKWAERTIISFVLGDGYSATGDLDKAEMAFEKIYLAGRAAGNLWTVSVALHKQALLKIIEGKLNAAFNLYQKAFQFASERGGQQFGSMAAIYVSTSDLLREWNDLEGARRMVIQSIKNMEHWQNPTNQVSGYVTLARISLAEGAIEAAEDALKKAEEISLQGKIFPITRMILEASQIRLWLTKGDLDKVDRWAAKRFTEEKTSGEPGASRNLQVDFLSELEWITFSRVLIARNELNRALQLLTTLAEATEPAGRYGRLIEIYILMTRALQGLGKREQALNVLTKSLALAEPEGYVRVFLDEGRPMEELLRVCRGRVEGPLQAYIDKLLIAFTMMPGRQTGIPTSPYQPAPLIEPLTGRELDVLHLLADGLSNQEIADRLFLSEGTIKTHTHNLYGKLGVQSRTRAIARAKELNLL
jgi:LuxR family maltose regulon positive regulatory protein